MSAHEIPCKGLLGRQAMIGKLQRVPLREVWKHEARDFTTWLQDNLDVLNDVVDLSLSSAEREQSAGTFSADLVAEDHDGAPVVIENQLEKSNHDHLGKLITYLTAIGANAGIWIVADPRPEHVAAISWLNESTNAAFYLLKVEAVKIENSDSAALLTLIVGPSEESKEVGATKKELAERHIVRQRFWSELLKCARDKTKLHSERSPGRANSIATGAGKSGLIWVYVIRKHETFVQLYIDRGKDAEEENTAIFDQLFSHKQEVEDAFGAELVWQRLDGRRACRVRKDIRIGGYNDESKWPEIQESMIDAMIRLERALGPYVNDLIA